MKTIQGPGIFLAQFAGDQHPFNTLDSICRWAAELGYKGVQIPSWDGRLFDLKKAAGSKKTSVEIDFGSTPGRFQNAAVSVSQISWTTSVSSFAIASKVKFRFGVVTAGFCPTIHNIFMVPARALSKMLSVS